MKIMSLRTQAISVIAMGMVLAGCTTDAPKPGDAPPPPVAAGAKLSIAGIGFQDDQFFRLAEMGMKDAAQKNGIDLTPSTSAGDLEKESSLVDTYIAKKVHAIVVAPLSEKGSVTALRRAYDKGIKIVTFDMALKEEFPSSGIKSDQIALGSPTGREAVEYIKTKLGGKANIAIIAYMSFLPEACSKRMKGFKDEVAKLPGVKFVAQQDAWVAPTAVTVVESILTAHPEVNLIWAANEGGTVGAVTAVKNSGKAGKVVVFGTDASEQIAEFLLNPDNILQAVTGQKPFDIGKMAVESAIKAVKGEKVEKIVELPGQLFSRTRPDEVKKYRDYLAGLAK